MLYQINTIATKYFVTAAFKICKGDSFRLFPKIALTDQLKYTVMNFGYVEHNVNRCQNPKFEIFKKCASLIFLGIFEKNRLIF